MKKGLLLFGVAAICANAALIGSLKSARNGVAATEEPSNHYLYLSTVDGFANMHVYTFGDDTTQSFGAWPGTAATDSTAGINFMSWGVGLIRITIPADCTDTKIIFSDTVQGKQTADLDIVYGAYYGWENGVAGQQIIPSEEYGHASALAFDLHRARTAVAAGGGILAGSVCGISAAEAASLVSRYDALTENERLHVDYTTDYTYNYDNTEESVNVSLYWVVQELRKIANSGASGISYFGSLTEDNANALFITATSIGSLAAFFGSIFIIKRRRLN